MSVPAFVAALDLDVDVALAGRAVVHTRVDVGYGGAFYAVVPASVFGLDVRASRVRDLVDCATAVTAAVNASGLTLRHPSERDLEFLYGTILTDDDDSAAPLVRRRLRH